jgi:hypothetical protein
MSHIGHLEAPAVSAMAPLLENKRTSNAIGSTASPHEYAAWLGLKPLQAHDFAGPNAGVGGKDDAERVDRGLVMFG